MIGIVFAKLGYGKKADKHNCIVIGSIFSLMIIFWILSLVFLIEGSAAHDTVFCIVYVILVPLVLAAWFFYARCSSKKEEKHPVKKPVGEWQCPKCGMSNTDTFSCQWCQYINRK